MSIGGYFELELPQGKEYYNDAISLNTGRNAFEYILSAKKYKKIYLPFYTCDVMLEPITKLNLAYEFYSIDSNFMPIFNFKSIGENDAIGTLVLRFDNEIELQQAMSNRDELVKVIVK